MLHESEPTVAEIEYARRILDEGEAGGIAAQCTLPDAPAL